MTKPKKIPFTALPGARKLLAVPLLAALLAACDIFPEFVKNISPGDPGEGELTEEYFDLDELDNDEFYAQDMVNEKYYKVKADILAEGASCVIWAERDCGVTKEQAEGIAAEYDTVIRPRIVKAFTGTFDILGYANNLAGRSDGKITILLLDIRDGYKNPEKDSYVAGYFFSGNFFAKGKIPNSAHYSNSRDMIYIDTYPGLKMKPNQTYATFAHELQHLINYITSRRMGRGYMDTWVDEGLSSWAEYLYYGDNPTDRCNNFLYDRAGTIAKGNNFFVWGNHDENPLSILDDYATVYLFFRWLSLHAERKLSAADYSRFFYNIITSANPDYRAVTGAAANITPDWNDWEILLRTWLAANYSPANTVYGYINDTNIRQYIKVKPIARNTSILLYPGEGVYSKINNYFTPSGVSGNNIRYAGLSANSSGISTSSPYTGNVLLTFNANASNKTGAETGRLTGAASTSSPLMTADRSAAELTGPYVIDARDFLGRNRGINIPTEDYR